MPGELPYALLLTEAGPEIGLGHLGRCVALYDALEATGARCLLLIAGDAPAHIVGERSFEVAEWRSPQAAASAVADADIAVIDSYVAALPVYEAVAAAVKVAAYLDDTARLEYPAGIVVNGSPAAAALGPKRTAASRMLLGPAYQLLRSPFTASPKRVIRQRVDRVLVIAGGTDAAGLRSALAQAAGEAFPHALVDVVDAPRSAQEIHASMLAADVAVTASGQTIYELAATGTPTVAVTIADNQVPQAAAFNAAGALRLAGAWGDDATIGRIVQHLQAVAPAPQRHAMSQAATRLVDGQGAQRVANACLEAAARGGATALPLKVLLLGPHHATIERCLDSAGDTFVRIEEPIDRSHQALAQADFIVSYGYRHLIPADVLAAFDERAVNLHVSMLPWNRGADPNLWSHLEDSPKGVSIHVLDAGLDTGPLLATAEVESTASDTLRTSYARLASQVEVLFCELWPRLRLGQVVPNPQQGAGTTHRSADKQPFEYLLVDGWDTLVSNLVGKALPEEPHGAS